MQNFTDHMLRFQKVYYRDLEPVCREWDLTRNELDVLLFLHNHPGVDRASDIVARRGIAKSHVSQSVAALEQRGLLLRRSDPRDRRTVHLELAPAARPLIVRAVAIQQAFFRQLCAALTPEDIRAWHRIAEKLQNAIEEMEHNKE